MKLVELIIGIKPKIIFTKDGRTRHEFAEKKWESWKDRFRKNPDYNWRNHVGTKAGVKK